ncbi:N,N-dimethylformamidase beta subunit family domain-containing protein [Streptacidiphilus sp. N1-12]|uniref:N,N-dimethylformamidase beta subunit family domain-containing protein n=2 Tax=Streptacidiphilus alkalitolerans TaxID=3342712 RepID=A0ABV6VLC5_9ACTN
MERRRFLGTAAAVAAAGAAGVGALVLSEDGSSTAGPGSRPGGAAADPIAAGRTAGAPDAEQAERQRPGDADWRIRSQGPPEAVEGYTDRISVLPGESFALHVSTTAPGFTVSAYRVGWYGGAQARLVWRSAPQPGRRQGPARWTGATRTAYAAWTPSLTVRTEGWPPGAYLLRLDGSHGHQRYVPMVLRSASARGRTVLMHGVATWQAYNLWGGANLYQGRDGGYGSRSLVVSFDRPYDNSGAEKFMVYERALVVLAERLGLPLAYTTGLEVHRQPDALDGARAVLSLGHDEYWTPRQRAAVTRARDTGTNLAFLGANACFRRIRWQAGDRQIACYKSDFRDDPAYATDRAEVTTDFRAAPGADPESSLTGVYYESNPVDARYTVHTADHWLFAGTGVRTGDTFAHLVGVEYDRVTPGVPTPRPIEILAHSPLVCNGVHSHSDSAYYTVPGGAGVFASGTMRWVEGLMAGTHDDWGAHGMDARTGAMVTRATSNLLTAFAEGPAAHGRPAPRDNVAAVYG